MKDTDGEPLTPPNSGPLSKDEMRSFIASTADEIVPFAVSLIVDEEAPPDTRTRLLKILRDEVGGLSATLRGAASDHAIFRSMIYRYTAAGVAFLALDERVRGEEVIAREMAQLDERGFFQKRSG